MQASLAFNPSCTGKIAYPTKADALHRIRCQAKRHRIKVKVGRRSLEAYRCESCKQWHVGSGPL